MTGLSWGISSIEGLQILISNTLSLIWFPPSYYSNDIPQWSITRYNIIIQNKHGSLIVNTNTTDTFYKILNNSSICEIYNITITAFIQRYMSVGVSSTREYSGSMSTYIPYMKTVIIYYFNVDYTINIQNFTLKFDNYENNFNMQFMLKVIFSLW